MSRFKLPPTAIMDIRVFPPIRVAEDEVEDEEQ